MSGRPTPGWFAGGAGVQDDQLAGRHHDYLHDPHAASPTDPAAAADRCPGPGGESDRQRTAPDCEPGLLPADAQRWAVHFAGEARRNQADETVTAVGWTWDPYADRWEEGFSRLSHYIERHGDARVPVSYTVDGYRLGWSCGGLPRSTRATTP
jgi:hypothetical protein